MAVGAVVALVYIAVGAVPKARNAVEVITEVAGWIVDQFAGIGEGVAPGISRRPIGTTSGRWRVCWARDGCRRWFRFRCRRRGRHKGSRREWRNRGCSGLMK